MEGKADEDVPSKGKDIAYSHAVDEDVVTGSRGGEGAKGRSAGGEDDGRFPVRRNSISKSGVVGLSISDQSASAFRICTPNRFLPGVS